MNDFKKNRIYRAELTSKYLETLGDANLPNDPAIIENVMASAIAALGVDYDPNAALPDTCTAEYSLEPVELDAASEFVDFLADRSDDLTSLTHKYLEDMAGKKLEWNIARIRQLLEDAINTLDYAGIGVCNPFHEDETPCYLCKCGGGCPVSNWECPMAAAKSGRKTFDCSDTIVAKCDEPDSKFALVINVKCAAGTDIQAAVQAAAKEFCESPVGKEAAENDFGSYFNYGDFVDYVPQDICVKHGFVITSTHISQNLVEHGDVLVSPN